MKTAKYSAYKPSGIEWLGDVPEHWRIDRLKASIVSCRNGIWGDEAQGDENDIPCVRVADFDRQKLRVELDEPTIRSVTGKERSGRLLSKGDLLLEKSGGGENQPVGCVVLYDDARPAVCSNFVARVVVANDQHSSYWRYVHAAAYAVRLTVGSINQTSGIQNLDQARYFNEYVAFPPPTEQAAIAAFLDRETAKIDALVEEQKRLIELLKEKRQAVISQAVTKGLDPSVPMKDSGVAWLGEVPAHWEVYRNKVLFKEIDDRSDDGVGDLMTVSHLTGVTRRSEKNVNMILAETLDGYKRGGSGDLVINTMWAWMGALGVSPCDGLFSPSYNVYRIRNPSRLLPSYYDYLCRVQQHVTEMRSRSTGIWESRLRLYPDVFLDMRVCVPPPAEQAAIVSTIVRRLGALDALNTAAEQGIQLLQERRSALISAAVTGKIDVRGLVPQPEVTAA